METNTSTSQQQKASNGVYGLLTLITGPMYSGKTAHLIDIYHSVMHNEIPKPLSSSIASDQEADLAAKNRNFMWLSHSRNTRLSDGRERNRKALMFTFDRSVLRSSSSHVKRPADNLCPMFVMSRSGMSAMGISETEPEKIMRTAALTSATDVFIDEAQFFNADQFMEVVQQLLVCNINVFIAALSTDFKGHAWPVTSMIFPIADDVITLHGPCANCLMNLAVYSHKKIISGDNDGKTSVDVDGLYEPLCRMCYSFVTERENRGKEKNAPPVVNTEAPSTTAAIAPTI